MWKLVGLITAPIVAALIKVNVNAFGIRHEHGEVTAEEEARFWGAFRRGAWTLIALVIIALIAAAIWWEWRSQITF